MSSPASVDVLLAQVTEQIDTLSIDPDNQSLFIRLIESFADAPDALRVRIAETLGEIGEPATAALAAGLRNHPVPVVRSSCAKTFMLSGDEAAIPTLIQAALHDPDAMVRGAAVAALARMGEVAVPELIKILGKEATPEATKGLAAWALAFVGAEAETLLRQSLETENVGVRAAVIRAFAKVTKENPLPHNFQILIEALDDRAAAVRAAAAATLGELAHQPAVPALISLLTAADWETQKAAALALMKIGDEDAIAPLQAALSREHSPDKQAIYTLAINQL
ncbi:MAG: HEAT repeat domain-containing protein [Cyanobacteria bacterium P01_A01_bin.105]